MSISVIHPLDPLTPNEISLISNACKQYDWKTAVPSLRGTDSVDRAIRFNTITLKEPKKTDLLKYSKSRSRYDVQRQAFCILQFPSLGTVIEVIINYVKEDNVWNVSSVKLVEGMQPLATPDDCLYAEKIVKADVNIQKLLATKYGIVDMKMVVCDPWSVHNPPIQGRLIQTFMYLRNIHMMDNAYAHPISFVPVVDLNLGTVVRVDEQYNETKPPPKVPLVNINYHKDLCEIPIRTDLKPLNVSQPDGSSFIVHGNEIEWQKWKMRISFNYREGLVLHSVSYNDGGNIRPIIHRASLVEMAVPYGDPHEPFTRKCAFDVGDYGLGNCANSLDLGCDCLGHVHYFDGVLNDCHGDPVVVKKVICLHEEDHGTLWKHVEYRNRHSEVRRSRRLVLSFIATVVNYEYCFYWYFLQDGTIHYEIELTGELSTNSLSPDEQTDSMYGTMVAKGVNSQFHQHLFCARVDMSVDDEEGGKGLVVSEVDVVPLSEDASNNPAGNGLVLMETPLVSEHQAMRLHDANKQRVWKISNPNSIHPITHKPVAWKLVIPPAALMLASKSSLLTRRGAFATKQIWVTPHSDDERWPAGDYTIQSEGGCGLDKWTKENRPCGSGHDPVLWITLAATHVPRVEDFPVMPCESVSFHLKPFCFFGMNPGVDVPANVNAASVLVGNTCCTATDSTA